MHRPWVSALIVLALAGTVTAGAPIDRLEQFKQLAHQYVDALDPAAESRLLDALFALADAEVTDNLRSGGPFASIAFIRERLEAFGEEWGGVSFTVSDLPGPARDSTMLGLFTVTRGEPRGSLRIYEGAAGAASVRTTRTQEGRV